MFDGFTLEYAIEKIDNYKTRKYFEEVYSSFTNGNYRATITTLYSVVLFDLFFKIEYMKDLGDPKANEIIIKIEQIIKDNPKSSEWESKILNALNRDYKLLESYDEVWLDQLKEFRNLCSHPVISQESSDLYYPNKDEVRGLMRHALEKILCKKPLYLKNIISEFVANLSELRDSFPTDEDLEKYINIKYLSHIDYFRYKRLVSRLWKFCFSPGSDDELNDWNINYRALKILFKLKQDYVDKIIAEKDESLFAEPQPNYIGKLCLLIHKKKLFECLPEHTKILIKTGTDKDILLYMSSTFLSDNIVDHISSINTEDLNNINAEALRDVLNKTYKESITSNCLNTFSDFCVKIFTKSSNYDQADYLFNMTISPFINSFSKEQILNLIKQASHNSQCSDRRAAYSDNKIILNYLKEAGGTKEDLNRLIEEEQTEATVNGEYCHDHIKSFLERIGPSWDRLFD